MFSQEWDRIFSKYPLELLFYAVASCLVASVLHIPDTDQSCETSCSWLVWISPFKNENFHVSLQNKIVQVVKHLQWNIWLQFMSATPPARSRPLFQGHQFIEPSHKATKCLALFSQSIYIIGKANALQKLF